LAAQSRLYIKLHHDLVLRGFDISINLVERNSQVCHFKQHHEG